jgi:steroid 5-alpha reductase family enzyme
MTIETILQPWGFALCGALIVMSLIAWPANRLKNAGLVDVAWGYGFSILVTVYVATTQGDSFRQLGMAVLVGMSSIRLGNHLLRRFLHEFPKEDGRYHALRQFWQNSGKTPGQINFYFYLIIIGQGVLMVVLSLPFLLACLDKNHPGLWELSCLFLGLLATLGEGIADEQLRYFKQLPDNKGQICQTGLWKLSRHPNYFCQWLIWVSVALYALPSQGGVTGLLSPLIMFILLTRFSGIQATESHMLQSRGEPYKQYQKNTPAFFPKILNFK